MKKILKGIVTSDKMEKSAVVKVNRIKVHPIYKKRTKTTKSYLVHNTIKAKEGDRVTIEEMPPKSRHKRFNIKKIIK